MKAAVTANTKCMRKLRNCILLIFLCIAFAAKSQVVVSGKVMDSLGRPLQAVSVTLKKSNGVILSFAISTATGSYKLQHATATSGDTLWVEANGIGYKKQSVALTTGTQQTDFKLVETSSKLPNVTVKNSPLRKEGDTLNYDVNTFSSKQDRTIGDVIKKLPGVEVAENGQISYGGKPINKFYIDGDDLLEGRYNIATKGIPNDMVAKVQVLENHQPVNALKNVVRSDAAAMNLVLKEKARLKIMGTGDAALGTPDVYSATVNTMLFQKQVKFMNYVKMNNMGVDLADETINHFASLQSNAPVNLLGAGGPGNPDLLKKRYLFNNAGLVNVNDMVTLAKDLQLRINAFDQWDRVYQSGETKSSYYLQNDTIRYAEKQDARTVSNTTNLQFTINANKSNYYLNNITILENTPTEVTASMQATSASNIMQHLNGVVTNFSNKFSLIKKTNGGKYFETFSFIGNVSNPATLQVEPGLYAAQLNNNTPFAGLTQYARVPSFYTEEYVSFGKASTRFQQQYRVGANYLNQDLNSELDAQQTGGSKNIVADSFVNRMDYSRLKAYVQTSFTYTTPRVTLNLVVPFTFQDTRYRGRLVNNQRSDFPVTPALSLKYVVGKEAYFTVYYNYGLNYAGLQGVYDSYIMRSYRNFYTNGDLLTQSSTHAVQGSYVFKNTLKIFFFQLSAGYNTNTSNTMQDAVISPLLQQSRYISFNNTSRGYSGSASVSKYIFPLMTTVTGRFQWNESISNFLQNGSLLQAQNDSYMYSLSITKKFSSWMDMNYNVSYNTFQSQAMNSLHAMSASPKVEKWLHEFVVNFNVSSNFYFKVSGDHYAYYVPGSQNNKSTFVDAMFTWKLNKYRTDLDIAMTNLGGADTYKNASLSVNSITESSFRIRPRMVMLRFNFRF